MAILSMPFFTTTTTSITICTTILLLCLNEGQAQDVTFQSEALSAKTKCTQLTRNDCLFYHEAVEKCGSVCDDLIKNGDKKQSDTDKDKDTGGKKKGCFHGDDLVITRQGPMRMSQIAMISRNENIELLSRDDQGQLVFSPVYYWIHKDAQRRHEFLTIETASGQKMSLTRDHLIYETNCHGSQSRTIFAERVATGKCVFVQQNGHLVESKVVKISSEMKTGIYAPITRQGNLIVNDVLASSFACLENEPLQKIMYQYMDWALRFLDLLTPEHFIELFYSTPRVTNQSMTVPEVVFSFWDLGKTFVRY